MLLAALPSLAWSQESASLSGLRLYDTFGSGLIDPSRWVAFWQCGDTALECVREIQNRQLRLRVRAYGDPSVDGGNQYSVSEQHIKSTPVTSFAAHATVLRGAVENCPTGAGGESYALASLQGAFFNLGDGTPFDDVSAILQLAPGPSGMMDVAGFLGARYQTLPGGVFLGQVNVGERVFLNLAWDQPNHRFITRLYRPALSHDRRTVHAL
jgi:hypothetical protein